MKLTGEIQELIALTTLDNHLEETINLWNETRFIPQELQKETQKLFHQVLKVKELYNQWFDENLEDMEVEDDSEDKITH